MAPKLQFSHDGILIKTEHAKILLGGQSPIETEIDAKITTTGIEEKTQVNDVTIHKKIHGIIARLPDVLISYIHTIPEKIKEYKADILILNKPHEKTVKTIKPKLAILMNSTVYEARELHKKTNIQVIATQAGTTIDLGDYNALAEQKSLSKFTE